MRQVARLAAKMTKKPTYIELISEVLHDGRKQSTQYIMKSIAYKKNANTDDIKGYVKCAMRKMMRRNQLTQVKGRGMIGSFRLNKQPKKEAKPTKNIGPKVPDEKVPTK